MDINENTMEKLMECASGKSVYLFGASSSAEKFIKRNPSFNNIQGIVDNDSKKRGTVLAGYKVYVLDDLCEIDKEKIVFVITSVYEVEIEEQLRDLGYQHIFSSHMCERLLKSWLDPIAEQDLVEVDRVRSMLEDDLSRLRLEQIVQNRKDKLDYWSGMYDGNAYFRDFFSASDNEVFIDGGAFTGDTIEQFYKWTQGSFKKVYAFEPDDVNYNQLSRKYINDSRIECINSGLWSENSVLNFDSMHSEASRVSEDGNIKISMKCIDDFVNDEVTFIKMDIEGSELEALKGCKNIIQRFHPKLAICIYHKYDDLWRIPIYIHDLVPEYKLYIRHHSLGCGDTVIYAMI